MIIPTELIGSIPRPVELVQAVTEADSESPNLEPLHDAAVHDTIERFEATGSPVITDGEQRKPPSALSLMYPADGLSGYSPEQFIDDLMREHEAEVRRRLEKGEHKVQIDFTNGGLAMKIDPSCGLLNSFIDLNKLLPSLFERRAGNFYIALTGEKNREHILKIVRRRMKPDRRISVGVVAPIDPHVETPEEVRDRVLQAAEYIPLEQPGTTDDCGFSPADDTSTSRDTDFARIRSCVLGARLAAEILGDA